MKRIWIVVLIAGVHLVLMIASGVAENATSAFLFAPPSRGHGFFDVAFRILEFPLFSVVRATDIEPGPLTWPALIVNSLLWGSALYYFSRLKSRRT